MAANKDSMAQRFAQRLMVESLRHKSDAEVLGFLAASLQDNNDDQLCRYMAQRLNAIAVVLEAQEAGR